MFLVSLFVPATYILIEFSKRKKMTPLIIFSSLWFLIVLMSVLGLFDLDKTSNQAYAVISMGIFAYGLGELISSKLTFKSKKGRSEYVLRDKVIYLLCAITILLYFMDLYKVISYIIGGQSLAYIRLISQDKTSVLYSDRSALESAIRMFIIQPFAVAFQVIVAQEFIEGKKRWIVWDIVIILLKVLSEGSRSLLVYLGVHLVLIFFFNNKFKTYTQGFSRIRKHKKRIIRIVFLVIAIVLVYTTMARSGERALRTTYYYFSMEPRMLDIWLEEIKEYGYGAASINGFVFPFVWFFKNLLKMSDYPSYWYNNVFLFIDSTDKLWQVISSIDQTRANAYVSIFFFPFLDGGYFGEFIIMFIFGFFARQMYKNAIKDMNPRNVCLYSYTLLAILFSFVRLQFADVSYALGFIFLCFVAFKRRRVHL